MMNTQSEIIINELKRLASGLFKGVTGMACLYGSRARGDESEASDWDILVITEDEDGAGDLFERYAFPFAELGWKYDVEIVPVHFTKSQWLSQRNTLFYNNVVRDMVYL